MTDMSVNQDTLTLEEANKVRISLGLTPIGAEVAAGEDAPVDTDAIAEANYAERRAEMKRAKEEKDIKERIEKSRNRSALNAKLKGSTLGDTNRDDSLSTKDWAKKLAKRAKQREKELAERRRRDMEEADKAAYDERDLAGLKVRHGAEQFEEGEDVILTLRDSRVLEGEEDELQNVNMVDEEAIKAAKERKRKAQEQYTGYDDEEFEEGRIGQKADILGKYDDEFSTGKVKSEGFRLGVPIEKKMTITDEDTEMIGQAPAIKVKLNLDYAKDFETSDYLKEGDAGFKKPKKKKVKRSARKAEDDEDDANGMEVDGQPVFVRREVANGPENLVDDDDLQAALSRARRENAKKKPKVKAEDLAAQIAQRKEEEQAAAAQETVADGDEDGRITFDDTSEFVRNVTLDSLQPVKRERAVSPAQPSTSTSAPNGQPVVVKIERGEDGEVEDGEDEDMSEDEDEGLAEMAAREGMSLEEYRLKIDSQMKEMSEMQAEDVEKASEPEPVVGQGMAGVLSLLRNQGALKKVSAEDQERERVQKQSDLWLADFRRRQAKRELERILARGGNKDQAQREWENKVREQQEARDALEVYRDYKPDINIVYHDEFGRNMTPKEAWKSLSHKFHGKTSGRMKTEKRLKKIAEERKQEAMIASDTPLGMSEAFARRAAKTGEAHMVLSVGNKGSVQASSKGKARR
ncbi:hypothetical protein EHS25_009165 [Saitozyma podzolica]|uniref:U4/U6.U5 tri-snRNP-associated protein 1 n=1 Tax=Saitozyma podzolica TaxID=1890683 RepID=A0A427YL14_9TREE|nr:hypothetical protein EHS25_009165 [Saitozyma podzolica]